MQNEEARSQSAAAEGEPLATEPVASGYPLKEGSIPKSVRVRVPVPLSLPESSTHVEPRGCAIADR